VILIKANWLIDCLFLYLSAVKELAKHREHTTCQIRHGAGVSMTRNAPCLSKGKPPSELDNGGSGIERLY